MREVVIATVREVVRAKYAAADKTLIERVDPNGTVVVLAQCETEPEARRRLDAFGAGVRVRVVTAQEARRLMTPAAPYVRRRR